MQLLMMEIGFALEGLNTEQHDIVFAVGQAGSWGEAIDDPFVSQAIRRHFSHLCAIKQLHIDGYAVVNSVNGHLVKPFRRDKSTFEAEKLQLYFANLGGYIKGEQREKHKAVLVVAEDITHVKPLALQDCFCKQMDKIKGAVPHVDDKAQIGNAEVDDVIKINDTLTGIGLLLEPGNTTHEPDSWTNWIITGYKLVP